MKLFNQSIIVQAAVVLLALAALWFRALAEPVAMQGGSGAVLYDLLAGWLAPAPLVATIAAMLLVLAEGVALNLLMADVGLVSQNSLLPTLLFIICMSAPATTLTPAILIAAILIACTRQLLLKGTLLTISIDRACTTTALIGLCSMFCLPAALMMISYMLVAINYRLYGWKDWAVLFLGFLAPYVLLVAVLALTGGLVPWWQGVTDALSGWSMNMGVFTALEGVANAALALALLAGVIRVWNLSRERTVVWQKNASVMLIYIIGGAAMLLTFRLFPVDMQLFGLPFSFCVACLLTPARRSMSRRKSKEWVHYTLLIIIFAAALLC